MSIWEHKDKVESGSLYRICRFCNYSMDEVANDPYAISVSGIGIGGRRTVYICPICGWWSEESQTTITDISYEQWPDNGKILLTVGSLKNLDLSNISTPISEIKNYLIVKYEKRFQINPKLWEETVASVFSGLGYDTVVTGKSGDGGIDAILRKSDKTVGVQIKRYKGKIKVEQIRSLAGALVLKGLTKGIFVTTSDYQKGASKTAEAYKSCEYPMQIELINSKEFYKKLRLSQISLNDAKKNMKG